MAVTHKTTGHATHNAKEYTVHLYLVNAMNRLNVDELTFFRMAHIYSFGTDPDLSTDVAQYKLHGIIPLYVGKYLQHIKEEST